MRQPDFIVIGENIHTTRTLTRKSPRWRTLNGREGLAFEAEGREFFLPASDAIVRSQDFEDGRLKHVKLAVQTAISGGAAAEPAKAYIAEIARKQEQAGARFLDLNVDEISIKTDNQKAAMVWLAEFVQSVSPAPLSIDSSNLDVIAAGVHACRKDGARPLLNSASLERIDALALAREANARVVVTAAGAKGMPTGPTERVENAGRMVEAARSIGIADDDIFIDPLIFPISVDKDFALHALDAVREMRRLFGPDVHLTGGFSNVSFGIPYRRAINDVFLKFAIEAGADSGIIDPVAHPVATALAMDAQSPAYRLAADVLLGRDEHCRNYIRAWRKGQL